MRDKLNVELWATAISTNGRNGRRIIFRYAKDFCSSFDRSSQSERIIIVWKYVSEDGQPSPEERRDMDLLEVAMEKVLHGIPFATLALVSTGENLREWTYYAQSLDGFENIFYQAIKDMPALPIEIHAAHDPTWSMYERFRSENPRT